MERQTRRQREITKRKGHRTRETEVQRQEKLGEKSTQRHAKSIAVKAEEKQKAGSWAVGVHPSNWRRGFMTVHRTE
jgi:hypothetical protein